jgi:hypothetical protein
LLFSGVVTPMAVGVWLTFASAVSAALVPALPVSAPPDAAPLDAAPVAAAAPAELLDEDDDEHPARAAAAATATNSTWCERLIRVNFASWIAAASIVDRAHPHASPAPPKSAEWGYLIRYTGY